MFARVVRIDTPADTIEQAIEGIRQGAANLRTAAGFQHADWIHDREHSAIISVVVFDSQEHADAAWATLGQAAMERARAMGSTPSAPSGGEVVHHLEANA